MHVFVITGTSRGIGESLAKTLLSPDHHLVCLSRGENPSLLELAKEQSCSIAYHLMDLANTDTLISWTIQEIGKLNSGSLQSINLIQNAAALRPVQPIGREIQEEALSLGVKVNLLAPMLMTEAFVSVTQGWTIPKKILNISSGAARRAVPSWSMYCSTKAALDMHSKCLEVEQQNQPYPVKVVSLAPGTVDTAMQDHLREQSKEVFPGVQRFLDLKREGKLWSPSFVATQIAKFLQDPAFGEETLMDLRNWVSQG
ncbi:MAG: SDR family NAD(P)-dependent oxidoreductase [Bacteroidota bacterium]